MVFLAFAAFRGPPEYLPIEAGARWTLANFQRVYADPALYTQILPTTLLFAVCSLSLSCIAALMLAWEFERRRSAGAVWLRLLILAPMALPTPALAVAWIQLLGPNAGWINQAWRSISGSASAPFDIFTMSGLVWCQGIAGIPFAYLLLAPAVRAIRRDLEEAAYVAGASPATAFRRIGMPTVVPQLSGPILVMFLVALEQVDFPYILGPTAGINVLGTRILWELSAPSGLPNVGGTAALATLVLAFSMAGLAVHYGLVRGRRNEPGVSLQNHGEDHWRPRWISALMRVVLGLYVAVAFVLPMAALLLQSTSLFPGSEARCCLESIKYLAGDGRFWRATGNTLFVATASAVVGTVLGFGIATCAAQGGRLGGVLDRLSLSSVAIPSILVTFGMAAFFLSLPIGIYGTVALLVIAYSYRIALATRMTSGALQQIGTTLQDAASVSGARWVRTQMAITVPLAVPSILASAAFLFVIGIKEFTIPLMLYSPENVVLSILLLQFQQSGNPAPAAAIGILMTALTMLGVAGLVMADAWLARKRSGR